MSWQFLCGPDWPQTCYVADDDLEHLIFLPLTPECQDCRCLLPCPISVALRNEPRALCILGKQSTDDLHLSLPSCLPAFCVLWYGHVFTCLCMCIQWSEDGIVYLTLSLSPSFLETGSLTEPGTYFFFQQVPRVLLSFPPTSPVLELHAWAVTPRF